MDFSRSLLLALGLHVGVAIVGRSAAGSAPSASPAATSYEVSVVLVPEPTQSEPAGAPGSGAAPTRVRAPSVASRASGPRVSSAAASGEGSGPGREPVAGAPTEAPEAPAEPERPVDLGLGGLWVQRGLPDRPRGGWQTGARAAGGLGQGLEARDQARGLGRGGAVATAARSAAISLGPSEGEATFSVETDREGKVTRVSLGEARGGPWEAVLSELRRALAQKRLRVPPGSNGLALEVLVRAKVQLPSGARPGHAVSGLGAGAEFDVADIAARPARVVSARVASERLL